MRKNNLSPVERKIVEIDKGLPYSKSPLSWMWQQFLAMSGTAKGSATTITLSEWRHCLTAWYRKKTAMGMDPKVAANRKSGISKRLAEDSVSWACFLDGVHVIMADGRFRDITMELVAYPEDGGEPRRVLMSLSGEPPEDIKAARAEQLREAGISELVPGMMAMPNQLYIISEEFNNTELTNEAVAFRGKEPRPIPLEELETMAVKGTYIMSADGNRLLTDWRVNNVVADGGLDD